MCGIAGYSGTNGNQEKLRLMAKALERRGPDDEGFYESTGVGFAFRRLSIIDVAGGHQPLSNEDGTVWVMLNGEIYGFAELREQLLKAGHQFATHSDTEVIVHAYEQWGDTCFEKLHGMFAIALWDSKKSELLLARDRFGKKPLYWTAQNNTIWFGSELKALLAANVVKKEIDVNSVATYFKTESVPTPQTIFKNVFKLEPATVMTWKNGSMQKKKFWTVPTENLKNTSEHDVLKIAREKIDLAVKERLVSDVPLGLFLSGGLDSSVVAESAARQKSGLQAFTIGFDDPSYDETAVAKQVADTFGLTHVIETLTEQQALATIEDAVNVLDEPLADPSILPQLFLSRMTHKHVTVALSGDGGDELLLGYQHIPAHVWAERLKAIPTPLLNVAKNILNTIPSNDGYFGFGFKAQRLARGLGLRDRLDRDVAWRGATSDETLQELFLPEVEKQLHIHAIEDMMHAYAQECPDPNSWSAWSWAYLRTYLMDDVLVKVDRATMWHSLEARAPLLDTRVVSFILNLPDSYKLGEWKGKRLFKELLKDKLPDSVLNAPKHGFGVPVAKWLNGPLKEKLLQLSQPQFLKQQNLFRSETIAKMIDEHATGKRDRRKELWAFLMFQLWYCKWIL